MPSNDLGASNGTIDVHKVLYKVGRTYLHTELDVHGGKHGLCALPEGIRLQGRALTAGVPTGDHPPGCGAGAHEEHTSCPQPRAVLELL